MAGKVKTWVWVVLAVVVTGVVAVVSVAGVGFYFFKQHIDTRTVSQRLRPRLRAVKARFSGQKPLVELESPRQLPPLQHRAPARGAGPEQLIVMAFDSDEGGSCA